MKNNAQGFTLIELLIVIAIIGILATALLPNLMKAREQGYNAAAQSCAKYIATTEEMYFIDNNAYASDVQALKGFDQGAMKVCDDAHMVYGGTGVSGAGTQNEDYNITVEHKQGSKRYTVTKNGITNATR